MEGELLWSPPDDAWASTRIGRFLHRFDAFETYEAAWRWSVDHLDELWGGVWSEFDVQSAAPYRSVLASREMPGAPVVPRGPRWNYAEHALRGFGDDDAVAVVARSCSDPRRRVQLTSASCGPRWPGWRRACADWEWLRAIASPATCPTSQRP